MKIPEEKLLIRAENISLTLAGRKILDDVTLAVHQAEITTIIGPNGAGKSTLVRAMLGLVPISAGRLSRKPGLKLGYVPQNFIRNSAVPLSVKRLLGLTQRPTEHEMQHVLEEVGIPHLLKANLATLSGGEMQRALVARALLRKPDLLVLDEPVQAVDFYGEVKLYELISAIRKKYNCGILMVSHDLHMVMAESDRVVCLNGHICCQGQPGKVQNDPEFAKLFGPQAARMIAAYTHHHDHVHDDDHHHNHMPHGSAPAPAVTASPNKYQAEPKPHQHSPGCQHE